MNKVTKESIDAKIKEVHYQRLSDKITHCIIILENGFQVTGESACVDPANYNQEIGEKIAYENAFDKIWLVEGYLLQEDLFRKKAYEYSEADELEYRGAKDAADRRRKYAEELYPNVPLKVKK